MFTTVHPVGQFPVPRVMVESVPRAAGHLKVPVAATPDTQEPIPDNQTVMPLSSMYFRALQFRNIHIIVLANDDVSAAIRPERTSEVQFQNM